MKRKTLAYFFLVLLIAGTVAACSNQNTVVIGNQELTFLKVDISESYGEIIPSDSGNMILTVQFKANEENPDITAISEALFGEIPCTVSNGTDTYPCKSIAFEENNGKIRVLPIFEVPLSFEKASSLTLSGNSFPSIQLNI